MGGTPHDIIFLLVPVDLAPVAVRKPQAIAEHDEDLVMAQTVIIEQLFFIGEVDGQAGVLGQGAGQGRADVVGIVRLVATEREGS
jgi:hypothetical protein